MYRLLISCSRQSFTKNLISCIDEDILSVPLTVLTCSPEKLSRTLLESAHILICDVPVLRKFRDMLIAIKEHTGNLSLLLLGSRHDVLQVHEDNDLSALVSYCNLLPLNGRELHRQLCSCIYCINDQELSEDPLSTVELWQSHRTIVHERFWYNLLSGQFASADSDTLFHLALKYDVRVKSPDKLFLPIIIKISASPTKLDMLNGETQFFAVQNLIKDLFYIDEWSIPVIAMSPFCYMVVCHCNTPDTEARAKAAVETFEKSCMEFLHLESTSYIGVPTTLTDLKSYGPLLIDFSGGSLVKPDAPPCLDVIQKIKQYIDENIQTPLSRQAIANYVFLNPDYMATLFKSKTGQCLSNYIVERKMEKAQKMLMLDDRPITDIATDLGYTNFSYFSRLFKKVVGLTPSEYRRRGVL